MDSVKIKENYQALFYYVKKRVNNPVDAEDIVQDVFLKMSKSNSEDIKNFKSWMYRITKNTIVDYYRKRKIEIDILEDRFAEEIKQENKAVEELSACIIPFIEDLPDEYRTLIKLSEIEGLSQKEIAEQLNMNYVTVRSKIQRGRSKLKSMFAKCCNIKQAGKGSIIDFSNRSTCC